MLIKERGVGTIGTTLTLRTRGLKFDLTCGTSGVALTPLPSTLSRPMCLFIHWKKFVIGLI